MCDNSCLTCIAASNDDRCNGYLDLKCNIGYVKGWNIVPFLIRSKEIKGYTNAREIEKLYPCKFHMTVDEYINVNKLEV